MPCPHPGGCPTILYHCASSFGFEPVQIGWQRSRERALRASHPRPGFCGRIQFDSPIAGAPRFRVQRRRASRRAPAQVAQAGSPHPPSPQGITLHPPPMWRALALLVALMGEMGSHPPPPACPTASICGQNRNPLAGCIRRTGGADCPVVHTPCIATTLQRRSGPCTAGHTAAQINPNVPFWNIKPALHVNGVMRFRIWLNGRTYCNTDTHGESLEFELAIGAWRCTPGSAAAAGRYRSSRSHPGKSTTLPTCAAPHPICRLPDCALLREF